MLRVLTLEMLDDEIAMVIFDILDVLSVRRNYLHNLLHSVRQIGIPFVLSLVFVMLFLLPSSTTSHGL